MVGRFLAAVLAVMMSFGLLVPSALAGDAAAGKAVFSANCAACHAGGRNVVVPPKSLKKDDLAKYGKDSAEAIIAQVTNGNGAMPAFSGKLDATQIENVAAYVLDQAEKGWS